MRAKAEVTDGSPVYRWRNIATMSSTRDREDLPRTFSRRSRAVFSATVSEGCQLASRVFVSAIRAPDLMIFDE